MPILPSEAIVYKQKHATIYKYYSSVCFIPYARYFHGFAHQSLESTPCLAMGLLGNPHEDPGHAESWGIVRCSDHVGPGTWGTILLSSGEDLPWGKPTYMWENSWFCLEHESSLRILRCGGFSTSERLAPKVPSAPIFSETLPCLGSF